jgi:biotin transport system ATP-binding protein
MKPETNPNPTDAMITCDRLTHRFHDGSVGICEVDLSVSEGELVIFAGANGSGKSTLLRHFNGLLLPTAGEVRIAGKPVREDLRWVRQFVAMVFQDPESQIVGETVWADAAFGPENLGFSGEKIRERVREALDAVGLTAKADQRPHTLSGGEKRRLAVAGILTTNPSVVMFDEPFSGLDYPGVCQVMEQIRRLRAQGRTLLVSTHELAPVLPLADRLVVLDAGRIVRNAAPVDSLQDLESLGVRTPCPACFGRDG